MTVKDLIELLRKHDQEATVVLMGGDGYDRELDTVEIHPEGEVYLCSL